VARFDGRVYNTHRADDRNEQSYYYTFVYWVFQNNSDDFSWLYTSESGESYFRNALCNNNIHKRNKTSLSPRTYTYVTLSGDKAKTNTINEISLRACISQSSQLQSAVT